MKTGYRIPATGYLLLALLLCPAAWGANDFSGDANCVALWRFESPTAFTETDPGADITVASTLVTWSNLDTGNTDSYVYRDYGAGYFGGDFTHKFQFRMTAIAAAGECWVYDLTQTVDDARGIFVAGGNELGMYVYNNAGTYSVTLQAIESAVSFPQDQCNINLATTYFVTVAMDFDGGANGTGQVTAEVHTGAYHPDGVHIDALTLDCSVGEQNSYQYLFTTNTWNGGSTKAVSGTVSKLEVGSVRTVFTAAAVLDDIAPNWNQLTSTAVVWDAVNQKEGTGCADFESGSSAKLSLADSGLDPTFPLNNGYGGAAPLSFCCWVKIESITGTHDIIAKNNSATGLAQTVLRCSGTAFSIIIEDGSQSIATTTAIQTGRWYHIGFTHAGSGGSNAFRLRVWDNTAGALLQADVTGSGGDNRATTTEPFYIGASDNVGDTGTNFFDGLIDELVFFDDVLTVGEIDQIRNGTYPIDPTISQWWWRRRQ